jgi:hypothetical protein
MRDPAANSAYHDDDPVLCCVPARREIQQPDSARRRLTEEGRRRREGVVQRKQVARVESVPFAQWCSAMSARKRGVLGAPLHDFHAR